MLTAVIISAIYSEYKKLQNATEDQAQYLEDVEVSTMKLKMRLMGLTKEG